MLDWAGQHLIEIFGAITGIIYVFLEIRQNIFLWPLGIITSGVYMYVFRDNGFYAGMLLQSYYLIISVYGWYAWSKGKKHNQAAEAQEIIDPADKDPGGELPVKRINLRTAVNSFLTALALWMFLWFVLDRWTDSPMPLWDGLITSLSVVATWMLTRKILEQWHVWIIANFIAVIVYLVAAMYPTAVLFGVYLIMAVAGLREWRKKLPE